MYAATSIVASSARLIKGCSSSLLYFGRCVSSLIKLKANNTYTYYRNVSRKVFRVVDEQ